jgi:hypothetical protein
MLTIYGRLVYFVVVWYTFSVLGCLDQEKSGSPGIGGGGNNPISTYCRLLPRIDLHKMKSVEDVFLHHLYHAEVTT